MSETTGRLLARRRPEERRGAIIVLVVVMMVAFLAMAAFSVDVAHMHNVETQLRTAADAAAKAGGDALGRGLTTDEVVAEVQQIAAGNLVGSEPLLLAPEDIQFGNAVPQPGQRYQFVKDGAPTDAVRVIARRTEGSPSGSIPLFFGGALGVGAFESVKTAAATVGDRDIVVVLDRSSSMHRQDAGFPVTAAPSRNPFRLVSGPQELRRVEALKLAVEEFRTVIDQSNGDEQLGLASFDRDAFTVDSVSLEGAYTEFDTEVSEIDRDWLGSGTNISAGIDEGVRLLFDEGRLRGNAIPVMIVMTDGQENRGRGAETAVTEAVAAHPHLKVYTVTLSRDADESLMQRVAVAGHGKHYHADNGAGLVNAFQELARTAGGVMIE